MILLLTVFRFLAPLLIFRNPKFTIFLAIVFDSLDYQFFPRTLPNWYEYYSHWDKVMDTYQAGIFFLYMHFRWSSVVHKRIGYALWILRTVGVVFYELTAWRLILFVFPDLFENFFVFIEYAYHSSFKLFRSLTEVPILVALTILGILKLIQEYFIHIRQVLPWQDQYGQLVHAGAWSLPINASIWAMVFVGINGLIIWLLSRSKNRATMSQNDLSLYILFQHFILSFSLDYDNRRTFASTHRGAFS